MKKITLLATFLLVIVVCYGQTYRTNHLEELRIPDKLKIEKNHSHLSLRDDFQNANLLLDSIYIHAMDGKIIGKETYSSDVKKITVSHYDLKEDNSWEIRQKTIVDYDNNNNLILIEYHIFNDGELTPFLKTVYAYNENNDMTLYESYQGTNNTNEWIKKEKNVYKYNDDNKQILEENYTCGNMNRWSQEKKYTWNYIDGLLSSRQIYYYNNNTQTQLTHYNYTYNEKKKIEKADIIISTNTYTRMEYADYLYDENDNLIKQEYYEVYTAVTRKYYIYEYAYDDKNNEISYESSFLSDGKWVKRNKIISQYNDSNNCISEETFIGNENDEWTSSAKYIYDYDTKNRPILQEIYTAGRNNDWLKVEKWVREYNENNNIILTENYSYEDNNEWKKESKYIYEYDQNNNNINYECYSGDELNNWKPFAKYEYIFKDNRITSHLRYESGNNYEWETVHSGIYYYSEYTGITPQNIDHSVIVYTENQTLFIQSPTPTEIITIYSISGNILYSGVMKNIPFYELSRGVIIIKGSTGWSKKIII